MHLQCICRRFAARQPQPALASSKWRVNNLGGGTQIHPESTAAQHKAAFRIWLRQLQGLTAKDAPTTLADAGASILQARQQSIQQDSGYGPVDCRASSKRCVNNLGRGRRIHPASTAAQQRSGYGD
jgi:hypothetical protein